MGRTFVTPTATDTPHWSTERGQLTFIRDSQRKEEDTSGLACFGV